MDIPLWEYPCGQTAQCGQTASEQRHMIDHQVEGASFLLWVTKSKIAPDGSMLWSISGTMKFKLPNYYHFVAKKQIKKLF